MKYRNTKTTYNGIEFDSKLEARRYSELMVLERGGAISNLILQPEFELLPSFKKGGKTYRRVVYRADFSYMQGGKLIVEDTKGFKTDVYKLKKKLFEHKYPDLTIREVTK